MILRALDGEDVLKECAGHDFLTSLMVDVVEHAKGDESPEVKACVAKKIPILMDEGYQQKQAIAIAFSQCSKDPSVAEKGKEVPKQGKMTDENLRQMGRDRLASIDGTKIPSISNTREVNLSVTEDQGLAATFLPSYARKVASPGREVKDIEKADRISKEGDTKSPFVPTHLDKEGTSEGAKRGWETRGGAAPVEEEEKKPKPKAEGILAQAVREALQEHLTQPASKPQSKPNDLDIDTSNIKPPDLGEWEEDLKRNEAKLRAKEDAAAREAEEKKQAREWNQKMQWAQRTFDSKAVARLRANMPERIKRQRKDLMDKVLAVLDRHGISKAGTSEGSKKGWESRKRGKQIANESHWSYLKRISQDRASRANERISGAKGETTEEKITNYVSDEATANLSHEERKQRLLDLAALGLDRNHPAVQRMFAKVRSQP
jgi:hypothetical protein